MSEQEEVTIAEMLRRIDTGWSNLQLFIDGLTEKQMTVPTDAAGWTVKDHLMHLVIWQNGITALLNRQSRPEAMGIDRELLVGGDFDKINAVIQQHHQDKPLDDVLAALDDAYQTMTSTLQSMSDEDLMRPYQDYAPDSDRTKPVYLWIVGDTYEHYAEHIPWMTAIAEQSS